jgi:hypothetical protein
MAIGTPNQFDKLHVGGIRRGQGDMGSEAHLSEL